MTVNCLNCDGSGKIVNNSMKQIATFKAEIMRKDGLLRIRDKQIATLTDKVAERDKELAETEIILDKHVKIISGYHEEVTRLKSRVTELEGLEEIRDMPPFGQPRAIALKALSKPCPDCGGKGWNFGLAEHGCCYDEDVHEPCPTCKEGRVNV